MPIFEFTNRSYASKERFRPAIDNERVENLTLAKTSGCYTAEPRSYLAHCFRQVLSGQDTDGRLAILEFLVVRGFEPPRHVHHNEDEAIYVLEGEVRVCVGDQYYTATPGSLVKMPRGIPHHFEVVTPIGKALLIISPSPFENYFLENSAPTQTMTTKEIDPTTFDFAPMISSAEKYGVEWVVPESAR